ncbi:Hsp20/alpha crystallin family protein [Candidatus Nitronereus thalassa]|uniref:Hsp20/alpha crystallin family protein n=1 Tax=Candidatus Nitronereus thalassa TaxID=3020898 RepID=A0ABU3KAC9_9BACT|nr:Hsp20/alpha crystallin family protein [Candidatus Nitronereus thalassa]MDT7043366.1 Hsp20/alpha crystallin family protein [Candidatus Nitronereus thalassa]
MTLDTQEIQAREKQAIKTPSEPTTTGPVFSPSVDIFEDDQVLTLVADMPGVPKENLTIDLRDDVLTVTGSPSVSMPNEETLILQEFEIGKYFRQFTLSEVINQEKIEAKLSNGVLRLILPKVGPAQPKKIQVKEG